MTHKKCAHCGEERPIELYRKYYNRNSLYAYCRYCEQIEARRKYLDKKISRSTEEQIELDNINKLYEVQTSQGLRANRKTKNTVAAMVAAQLERGVN